MSRRLRLLVAGLALVFLAGHLRALPRTLEDRESIDLALGVEHLDVVGGQPPAPGSPVYIGLARISTFAVGVVAPGWDRDRRAAVGLAVPGLVAGTLAPWAFTAFWLAIGLAPELAFLAALLAVSSPLFWFGASRPLPDVTGVVVALAVATAFIEGLRQVRDDARRTPRLWVIGAVGAGLVIGIWPQAAGLVVVLLAWCVGESLVRGRAAGAAGMAAAAAGGLLTWLAPVVVNSGGVHGYLNALGEQSAENLSSLNVLAATPTWRTFVLGLRGVLVEAWQAGLPAAAILVLAATGLVWLAARRPRVLAIGVLVFWPYLLLLLVFEPTDAVRFALPIVIASAGLAVIGLFRAGLRPAQLGVAAVVLWSLVVIQPRLEAYAAGGAPAVRAFEEMRAASREEAVAPIVRVERPVSFEVGRAVDWTREVWPLAKQVDPEGSDWAAAQEDLRGDAGGPVWFVTGPGRTGCPSFDWRSCRMRGSYHVPGEIRALMGGSSLDAARWWEIRAPLWMLGGGWVMSPGEVASQADADGGPSATPLAVAYLERRPAPTRLLIGGRQAAVPGVAPAVVTIEIDDRPVGQWTLVPGPSASVVWLDVGDTSGPGRYARLSLRSSSADGETPAPLVSLDQFDAASGDDFVTALGDGFYEARLDPASGRVWRWMADRAELEVRGGSGDGRLIIAGESPLNYFGRPPVVVVRAGDRQIGQLRPSGDFLETLDVPADALAASGGRLTIETDLSFVPAERGTSRDSRRLGLHLFQVRIERVP